MSLIKAIDRFVLSHTQQTGWDTFYLFVRGRKWRHAKRYARRFLGEDISRRQILYHSVRMSYAYIRYGWWFDEYFMYHFNRLSHSGRKEFVPDVQKEYFCDKVNAREIHERFANKGVEHKKSITDAVAHSTVQLSYELDATAIITPTETGFTTQMVSKYRPQATIIAYAGTSKVARQLNLRWGVQLVNGRIWDDEPDCTGASIAAALRAGLVEKGDIAVVTSGITMSKGNNTNKIQIRTID